MKKEKRPENVVITGGTGGVGRATVRAFARQGANITIIARNQERLEETRNEVESLGGRAIAVSADVADPFAVDKAAEEAERAFGPIDIWVNNAMTSVFSPFMEMTLHEFKRVTDVTYLGYVNGTMAALKRMKPRDHGTIVQVGSALAYRSIPLQSAYCGAKHAIVGFTDSIRSELMHDRSRVRITAVHLPAVNTPQFDWVRSRLERRAQPVPPIFQPEVPANAIVWAARARRRELYVGWPTVKAIWIQKIMPGFADWYLAKTNYEAQQTNQPENPDRPDDLFNSVPGDFEAHGRFSKRSKKRSMGLWLTKNKYAIFSGLALAGCTSVLGIFLRNKKAGKVLLASTSTAGRS